MPKFNGINEGAFNFPRGGHWLRQVRIEKAVELMETSDLPATEIAHVVGFVSLGAFERAFKKHTRMTPLQFKKSVRPD